MVVGGFEMTENINNQTTSEQLFKKSNEENLKRVNKQNIKLIVASVSALCVMAVAKFGFKKQTLLGIVIVLFLGGGGTMLCNLLIKDNVKKAIAILADGGIAAIIYSVLMGGSSSAFIVQYVILGLSYMYFNAKITTYCAIPMAVLNLILAFVYPQAIEGPGGATVGAIAKVILFVMTVIMTRIAILEGEKINRNSFGNAYKLKETSKKSHVIANN
jgi:methyl-accepting chemotaxis protein